MGQQLELLPLSCLQIPKRMPVHQNPCHSFFVDMLTGHNTSKFYSFPALFCFCRNFSVYLGSGLEVPGQN